MDFFTAAVITILGAVARAQEAPPPCEFCPDGITADPDVSIPLAFSRQSEISPIGETCSFFAEVALSPDEKNCGQIKLAEAFCCPTDAGGGIFGDLLNGLLNSGGTNEITGGDDTAGDATGGLVEDLFASVLGGGKEDNAADGNGLFENMFGSILGGFFGGDSGGLTDENSIVSTEGSEATDGSEIFGDIFGSILGDFIGGESGIMDGNDIVEGLEELEGKVLGENATDGSGLLEDLFGDLSESGLMDNFDILEGLEELEGKLLGENATDGSGLLEDLFGDLVGGGGEDGTSDGSGLIKCLFGILSDILSGDSGVINVNGTFTEEGLEGMKGKLMGENDADDSGFSKDLLGCLMGGGEENVRDGSGLLEDLLDGLLGLGTEPSDNPCNLCPNGITAGEYALIPADKGVPEKMCGQAIEQVASFAADSLLCELSAITAVFCCPDDAIVENPCPVCPSGITAEAFSSTGVVGMQDTSTCSDVVNFGNAVKVDDPLCESLQLSRSLCCPDDLPGGDDPCIICPEGLSVQSNTLLPDSDGMTCETGLDFIKSFTSDSALCQESKATAVFCCPEQLTPMDNGCPFCKVGLAVDGTEVIDAPDGETYTCNELVGYAALFDQESETCSDILQAEFYCCPTLVGTPCPYCTDGLAVDGTTAILRASDGETCVDLVDIAPSFEAVSETCSDILLAEFLCCPSSAAGGSKEPSDGTSGTPSDKGATESASGTPEVPVDETSEEPADDEATAPADEEATGPKPVAEELAPAPAPEEPAGAEVNESNPSSPDETLEVPSDEEATESNIETPEVEELAHLEVAGVEFAEPTISAAFRALHVSGGLVLLVFAIAFLL